MACASWLERDDGHFSTGKSGLPPHSVHEPSYSAFGALPMASSANHRVAAVTPEPQLVMTGLFEIDAAGRESLLDLLRRDQPAVFDQLGHRHVLRPPAYGRIGCPRAARCLPAEAVPAGRASTTCAEWSSSAICTSSTSATTPCPAAILTASACAWLRRSRPGGSRPSTSAGRRRECRPAWRRKCGTSTTPAARRQSHAVVDHEVSSLQMPSSPTSFAKAVAPGSMCGSRRRGRRFRRCRRMRAGMWPATNSALASRLCAGR